MTDPADSRWPTARLDRIARARALAAAAPGTWFEERVIHVPFDALWAFLADLEHSVPAFDTDVARLRVLRRDGSRLRIRTLASWKLLWFPSWFDVDLHEGWCLMTSRPQAYVIVMAAEPAGPRSTRLAHLEGIAVPGPAPLRRLLRPLLALSRHRHRRHLPHDLDAIERHLTVPEV
jgi:hypothetical protein